MTGNEFLYAVLGARHPGRLIIRTAINLPAALIPQASDLIVNHLIGIYSASQATMCRAFEDYAKSDPPDDPDDLKDFAKRFYDVSFRCTYPYLYVDQNDIENINLEQIGRHGPWDKVLDDRPHYSEFAEPAITKTYLISQVSGLLRKG